MKKLILFLCGLIILSITNYAYAFDIVFPKAKTRTVYGNTTFFIGSSKTPIFVNGTEIPRHHTDAFAYFTKLNDGINTFKFKTQDKEEIYTITKQKPKVSGGAISNNLIEFQKLKPLVVKTDNTPLRSTPVNSGINRLSHLQKGVLLYADAKKSGFYRVKLNDTQKAWISQNNVLDTEQFTPAKIFNYNFNETKTDYIFSFLLDKKVPFIISEADSIKLKFFNTEKEALYYFPYNIKTGKKMLYGYDGYYVQNGDLQQFIFKIRKPVNVDNKKPLKNIKVVVDPGHGGKETGTTGCFGDKEKDVVLKISKYLEQELKSRGADVYMTRTTDSDVELYDRVKFTKDKDALFFISIHNNALPENLNPNEHRGTSVYYYYEQAKPFAQTVLDTMIAELGTKNDNLHQASFAVVRNTSALSILIEVAYLINPDDNELLMNLDFQKRTATAIADGLEKFILSSN